jgi:hypothetical protein
MKTIKYRKVDILVNLPVINLERWLIGRSTFRKNDVLVV